MKSFKPYFFLIPFLIFSCAEKKQKKVEVPSGVLSKDSFSVLLRDFALAESAANINVNNTPLREMDSVYAFDPLKQHNVRQSQYDSTVRFYVDNPKLYKEVYDQVLEQLSTMESTRTSIKKDSLQKVNEEELKRKVEKTLMRRLKKE